MKAIRIMLTGGGTAGHVWPLILMAEELRRLVPVKFLYVGSSSGIEREIVRSFYQYQTILVGKWRRYFSVQNILDLFRVAIGIGQAIRLIKTFKTDVIIAKGGFVSLPLIVAGRMSRVPIIIHESDIIMGATNRFAARFAQKILTGFPVESYPKNLQSKIIHAGNPVRQEFWYARKNSQIIKRFKLNGERPICLIIGGTQGSVSINSFILSNLKNLLTQVQIIHITGANDYRRCLKYKNELPPLLFDRYQPMAFVKNDLPQLYGLADIVVSRAGASTLAEIAAAGKAAIIIPLSSAAADHQHQNAKWYSKHKAIIMEDERSISGRHLAQDIVQLAKDSKKKLDLAQTIHRLADKSAALRAAHEILRVIQP